MITKEQAHDLVRRKIESFQEELPSEDELMVLEGETIEKEWGWVVFWTSRLWHGGDFKYALAGNAPFLVTREAGQLLETGTADTIENYISNFETTGNPHG